MFQTQPILVLVVYTQSPKPLCGPVLLSGTAPGPRARTLALWTGKGFQDGSAAVGRHPTKNYLKPQFSVVAPSQTRPLGSFDSSHATYVRVWVFAPSTVLCKSRGKLVSHNWSMSIVVHLYGKRGVWYQTQLSDRHLHFLNFTRCSIILIN